MKLGISSCAAKARLGNCVSTGVVTRVAVHAGAYEWRKLGVYFFSAGIIAPAAAAVVAILYGALIRKPEKNRNWRCRSIWRDFVARSELHRRRARPSGNRFSIYFE